MKLNIVLSTVLCLSLVGVISAAADDQGMTLEQIQMNEIENEAQNLAIEDTKVETKIGKDEARFVEKQAEEAKAKLAETREKKRQLSKKAKKEIADSLWRQHVAEKKHAKDTRETQALETEMVVIQKKMDKALIARNKAETKAKQTHDKLVAQRQLKVDTLAQIKKYEKEKLLAERRTEKAQHEYLMAKAENKIFAERMKKAQAEAAAAKAKALAMKAKVEALKKRRAVASIPAPTKSK